MHVLFCSSMDLKDAKYIRDGSKNLLQVSFGTGDTIAMCGKVVECKRTKFGVMLTLNDDENFIITAGTFNKKALEDAVNVLQKFSNGEIYLLIYANPFYKGAIYLNANQDYSVIEVTKDVYEKFHEIRKRGLAHLTGKFKIKEERIEISKKEEAAQKTKEAEVEKKEESTGIKEDIRKCEIFEDTEISEEEYKKQREINLTIVKFVENLAKERKDKVVKIDDVVSELHRGISSLKGVDAAGKIYELMEKGYFYEPRPGYIKVIT